MISNMKWKILSTLKILLATVVSAQHVKEDAKDPSVLVVTLDSIHRMKPPAPLNLLDNNYTLTFGGPGRGDVKAIDIDYANKSFCYIHTKVLFRASEFVCASGDNFTKSWKQPNPTLFPSQFSVSTMARDWASGNWYFADRGRRCLYVCDGSLRNCRVLQTNVEEPLGLAVDPTPPREQEKAGFFFWTQNNKTPSRLVRGTLAADDLIGLLSHDCTGPCNPRALTLDIVDKKVYWIDGSDVVAMSNYDGSGKIIVYDISEAYNRDIKAFSVFKSKIYMSGYRSLATVTLDINHSPPRNATETYINVLGFPTAALVYHGSRQPEVSHPCMENKGGCEHICVTVYKSAKPVARCLCRHGFQLDAEHYGVCVRIHLESFMLLSHSWPPAVEVYVPEYPGVSPPITSSRPTVADFDTDTDFLYFSDTYENRIVRQELDGTEREDFIKDIYECQGLAVDWMGGNLYWTDDPLGRVSVARLSNPAHRRELIRQGSYHPYSIVLDPQRGVMYWSVWARGPNPSGSIEMAHMDGSERRSLVSEGLEWPNGLALDMHKQVLYWCDTKLNKIERLDLATEKRTTILAAPEDNIKEPYGLVLDDGDIIWSEKTSGLVRRLGAGGNFTTIDSVNPPLYDIRKISRNARRGRNACSSHNGGCTDLCLATPMGRTCACAAGRSADPTDPTRCVQASPL